LSSKEGPRLRRGGGANCPVNGTAHCQGECGRRPGFQQGPNRPSGRARGSTASAQDGGGLTSENPAADDQRAPGSRGLVGA
jgi:hypothetical protein